MKLTYICMRVCVSVRVWLFLHISAQGSLTCARHRAWIAVGSVKAFLANALRGFLLRRRTVRRTFVAVGVSGRGLVGPESARWGRGERHRHKVNGGVKVATSMPR